MPIAYCLLPLAYCLLPIAYCLLPIAYCLLPIAYYLQGNLGSANAYCQLSMPIADTATWSAPTLSLQGTMRHTGMKCVRDFDHPAHSPYRQ